MRVLGVFVILVLIVAGYFFLAYHVVRTDSGRVLVKKQGMRFSETFLDIMEWQPEDLDEHPRFTEALIAAGRQDIVDQIAATEELEEPAVGGLGGVMDPAIESQSASGSQKTGGRVKDRARAAGKR